MSKNKTNGSSLRQEDVALNILNRPKRSINYEKFDYSKVSPDFLKQLDEESETEDEEFIPLEEEDEANDGDKDSDEDESQDSDESENSSDNENNKDEPESQEKITPNKIKREPLLITQSGFRNEHKQTNISKDKLCAPKSKKLKKEEKNEKSRVLTNTTTKKTHSKKKTKSKIRLQSKQTELDEDTQKIINSFRTTKIKVKKSKQIKNINPELNIKQETINNSVTISKIASVTYASQNISLVPPRDKYEPITDFDSAWICSLCSQPANFILGIGDLFGPYRISLDTEQDKINGNCILLKYH
jgi:hypothetical protein